MPQTTTYVRVSKQYLGKQTACTLKYLTHIIT